MRQNFGGLGKPEAPAAGREREPADLQPPPEDQARGQRVEQDARGDDGDRPHPEDPVARGDR